MGAIASQITSLTIVYSAVYSDADERKHQSSASLPFITGISPEAIKWGVDRYDRLLCPGLQPGPPSQTPGGLGQRHWSVSEVTWPPQLELRRWRSSGPSSVMYAGNSRGTGEFPAQMTSNAEMFPFDDVIMLIENLCILHRISLTFIPMLQLTLRHHWFSSTTNNNPSTEPMMSKLTDT